MAEDFFCPVCGARIYRDFSLALICPCCGTEAEVDDAINREDIDKTLVYEVTTKIWGYYERNEEVPKELRAISKSFYYSNEEAWEILRKQWIEKGCIWKWNDNGEKPENWDYAMAMEQLKNVDLGIEQVERSKNRPISD